MDKQVSDEAKYVHDCMRCKFLGHFDGYDLYFHEAVAIPACTTVLARASNLDADYFSGLVFSKPFTSIDGKPQAGNPHLVEARRLAIEAGFGKAIEIAEKA